MSSTLRFFFDSLSTGFFDAMFMIFIDAMCIGFLIVAEAKLEESDLMVFVSDLEECEFRKNSVLIF